MISYLAYERMIIKQISLVSLPAVLILFSLTNLLCLFKYYRFKFRRGAAATPASAGGYNIGNKGSTYSVSSALGK